MPISRPASGQDGFAQVDQAAGEINIYSDGGTYELTFDPGDPLGWISAATVALARAGWSVRGLEWVPTIDGQPGVGVRQVRPLMERGELHELHAAYTEWRDGQASANDVEQAFDDYLTARGFPTVLYR